MPFLNANSVAAGIASGDFIPVALMGGKVRAAVAEFTLATDVAGTYTAPIRLPRGARPLALLLNSSVSLGSSTVAVGIAGTVGKYRAAAVFTTADQLVISALNAPFGAELLADEQIIITTAVASLPASGRLMIAFLYVDNS
jgi:hypothetical protein